MMLTNLTTTLRTLSRLPVISATKTPLSSLRYVSNSADLDQSDKRGENRSSLSDLGISVGKVNSNFITQSISYVPEFDVTLVTLQHEKTKASYIHIDCSDRNNTFAIAFRTPATDNTGVAHILEHSVLCGSKKFPVRDPFFTMLKRSLNTFMNAWTASDHTAYPFSTKNAKDFRNLMDVYLDATFFPLLRKVDFLQEGHRFDFDQVSNNLIHSGIVYNEMKGRRSSSSSLFMYELSKAIQTGTCYENDAAGIPKYIPGLKYEDFRQFHRKHYHPSNALFFSYGDLSLSENLKMVDELVLSKFEFCAESTKIGSALSILDNVKNNSSDGKIKVEGPVEAFMPTDIQTKYCLAKKIELGENLSYESFKFAIFSTLLLDGVDSIMYEKIIKSQLAPEYSPGAGFDGSTLYPSFSLGVQNIKESDVPVVKEEILSALRQISVEGFSEKKVESTLHQFELNMKNKSPMFGMSIFQALCSEWTHGLTNLNDKLGVSLLNSLRIDEKIAALRKELISQPNFWGQFVTDNFLTATENHFTEFVMVPDEGYLARLEVNEKLDLAKIESNLSSQQKQEIAEMNKALSVDRENPQNVNLLPTLTLEDIPRMEENPVELITLDNADDTIKFADVKESTNDVVYVSMFFEQFNKSTEQQMLYLPLFCTLLGNISTRKYNYADLSVETQQVCSGFSFKSIVANSLANKNDSNLSFRTGINVEFYCFKEKLNASLALLHEIMTESKFLDPNDPQHLRSIISSSASSASNSISDQAMQFARSWAGASFNEQGKLNEILNGITQVSLLTNLNDGAMDLRTLDKKFRRLAQDMFLRGSIQMKVVQGSKHDIKVLREQTSASLQTFKNDLKRLEFPKVEVDFDDSASYLKEIHKGSTFFPLQIPVHNIIVLLNTGVSFGHVDSPAMNVLATLVSSNFLHTNIREKGGAYGATASHNELGQLTLGAYYDPQSIETLNVFQRGIHYLLEGKFSEQDVQEAILSVFASIDAPKSISTAGGAEFLNGLTNDAKQRRREEYFKLNKNKLMTIAQKHLSEYGKLDANVFSNGLSLGGNASFVIFGNEETARKAPFNNGNWKIHTF